MYGCMDVWMYGCMDGRYPSNLVFWTGRELVTIHFSISVSKQLVQSEEWSQRKPTLYRTVYH